MIFQVFKHGLCFLIIHLADGSDIFGLYFTLTLYAVVYLSLRIHAIRCSFLICLGFIEVFTPFIGISIPELLSLFDTLKPQIFIFAFDGFQLLFFIKLNLCKNLKCTLFHCTNFSGSRREFQIPCSTFHLYSLLCSYLCQLLSIPLLSFKQFLLCVALFI